MQPTRHFGGINPDLQSSLRVFRSEIGDFLAHIYTQLSVAQFSNSTQLTVYSRYPKNTLIAYVTLDMRRPSLPYQYDFPLQQLWP